MENLNYKDKNIETKYFKNMQKTKLKLNNGLLELKKGFIEFKHRELRNRNVNIKREIKELFFKPITVFVDDMGKVEQKETKKKRPIKNAWCDWLSNYIPKSIRKIVGGFKDKVGSKDYDKKSCMGEERSQANQKHKNNLKKT